MSLTVKDVEWMQAAHSDYPMELVDGNIIVMSPSGYESEEVGTEFARQLGNWARPQRLGRVAGSSAGFILPNQNLRAPDVSFVLASKLRQSTADYLELLPDLMVEVKSKTDSLENLRAKIQEFISLGTQIGILIDPHARSIEIYRTDRTEYLQDGDILTLPDLLPGWEVPVSELWPPVFED